MGISNPIWSSLVKKWAQGEQKSGKVSTKLGRLEVKSGFIKLESNPLQILAIQDFLPPFDEKFPLLPPEIPAEFSISSLPFPPRSSSCSSSRIPTGICNNIYLFFQIFFSNFKTIPSWKYSVRTINDIKFIYCEKAANFCEISTLDLSYVVTVKSTVEISQNFVAFSEYMNFKTPPSNGRI